jgi:ERCC4-type nuclease
MKLIIDNRECKIIELLRERGNINYTIQQCELGDFVFYNDNANDDDNIQLIIERKTINDMYSSINDGRYREQKLRLMSNYNVSQILYIIENDIYPTDNRYNIINGAILNTTLRDKIRVIQTKNLTETCYTLEKIYKKISMNPLWFYNNISNTIQSSLSEYSTTIKTKKKDNLTPYVCQIIQLAQIPGVSNTISKLILEHYKSLSNLIINYSMDTNNNNELKLSNLIIITRTGKPRKLGKILSERIYNYLMNPTN